MKKFLLAAFVLVCADGGALWTPSVSAGPLDDAAERYRLHLIADIDHALARVRMLRERAGAGDLDGAKRAWIEARVGWERSEVFTSGFVPVLDQQIDAWPNALHGFHGIETKLFGTSRVDIGEEIDALRNDLSALAAQVRSIPLTPQGLLNGIVRLAYEVGESKTSGGESRVSGTSLNDMQSNADGIALAYRVVFLDAVARSDNEIAQALQAAIQRLKDDVKAANLRDLDSEKLRNDSEELVVLLQHAAPKIGLSKPSLEETPQ